MIELLEQAWNFVEESILLTLNTLDTPNLIETVWKYLPFTPVLILLWPIFLTLLLSVTSTSTWIFWLFTSLIFGCIQLIYVFYQFGMIFVDVGMLSLLKTFALLRSTVRHFTIKSGLSKRNKGDVNNGSGSRGRKKHWRKQLSDAKDYFSFLKIEILEPVGHDSDVQSTTKNTTTTTTNPSVNTPKFSNSNNNTSTKKNKAEQENIRRIQSCINLDHDKITTPPENTLSKTAHNSIIDLQNLHDSIKQSMEKELGMTGNMLLSTTSRLQEARMQCTNHPSDVDASSGLKFLLSGVVKRNHLSVDDILIDDSLSVMESGQHRLSSTARTLLVGFNQEVERCLDWVSESSLPRLPTIDIHSENTATPTFNETIKISNGINGTNGFHNDNHLNGTRTTTDEISIGSSPSASPPSSPILKTNTSNMTTINSPITELSDRINLVRKLKHNMGRTALMLSGGGAQAMYHLGTVKALCESELYQDIGVISGTSGGSITAAMCALKTPSELLKDVCVSHVSTDYGLTGQMKRDNIRWFPKVVDMGVYWLQHKLLVDSKEFKRCCDFYFGDVTFEEAFERTGKHVCITVSASRAEGPGSGSGGQRLLLNHISTPHVTLASAVAASCALPGVMAPAKLVTKNSNNKQELFEVDGVEWIDGSVQADLPFKRISTLFNVSNYIVCQTNFHVLPFLHKAHHPSLNTFYWRAFQTCEWDIRNRALNLSRLGLFPKIFGQDISKVFKQKYHAKLTLVPKFTTMQVFGLKALVNPTVEDMTIYLQNGQAAAWPYLSVIKEMLRTETAIVRCLNNLEERMRLLSPDNDNQNILDNEDLDSLTSATQASRSRMLSAHRESELLKQKVFTLEHENVELKGQLQKLQEALMKSRKSNKTDDVNEE